MRKIRIDGHIAGNERTVTIMLRGSDEDFINMIDEGSGKPGILGALCAHLAESTGLVAESADDLAIAARLMRRAADLLDGAKVR